MYQNYESITEQHNDKIEVEVIKGKYVIKNIFKKILAEILPKQEMCIIGVDESRMEVIEPVYLKKVLTHFKRNKIKERVIISKGSKKLEYAKTTRYRHLRQSLIGNTAKFIYQDTVIEILYGQPTYAIVIKNQELADTNRKQFELLWKAAIIL